MLYATCCVCLGFYVCDLDFGFSTALFLFIYSIPPRSRAAASPSPTDCAMALAAPSGYSTQPSRATGHGRPPAPHPSLTVVVPFWCAPFENKSIYVWRISQTKNACESIH